MFDEQGAEAAPEGMQILALAASGENLVGILPEDVVVLYAEEAIRHYEIDRESMSEWLGAMQKGVDLAKLVKGDKDYPFKNAANVKYPLVTTAALQFNARAYPAIVADDDVVKVKVYGQDPMGQKAARADRVSQHMSWQLLNRIDEWEEETDKLLTILPIVGTVVRKVWFDPIEGRPRCRIVDPDRFVVNNKVKTLESAPRLSEEITMFPDEIARRKVTRAFADVDIYEEENGDRSAPQDFIEQHCRMDIDGDGYDEPYVITVHKKSRKAVRLVGGFEPQDVVVGPDGAVAAIKANIYFVPYHFLPSMDGGFFGTGFGLLLGDISSTVNTTINMMLDAGHMAALGGGFIGTEFKIRGGSQRFQPGEWKLTGSTGMDIRNSIVPMTFPGPDATLFQMLGLLIEAGKEVASVKDIMTGDTGTKNMTATTTLALIEQGMMVFTAAYKRIFRSLRKEYKLIAAINATTVSPEEYNAFHDATDPMGQPIMLDPRAEYSAADMDITPVADPRSVTKMQEAAKAQIVMQMAEQGLVDKAEGTRRILSASSIPNVEELLPKPDPMQQQMAMMAMKAAEADVMLKMVSVDEALAQIQKIKTEAMRNMAEADAKQRQTRLDEMTAQLEAMRDGLAASIGRGPQGMAGGPGGANPAPMPRGPFGASGGGI